jgi:cell division protein ZapA
MSDTKRPTTEITLLGRQYKIACDPGEEAKLERAAHYLDRAMHGIHAQGNVLGNERIAVMAALNISHELLKLSRESASSETDIERDLRHLEEKIDLALEANRQIEI